LVDLRAVERVAQMAEQLVDEKAVMTDKSMVAKWVD
jgi:uncharacterized protein YmfQ (DUF2313 family)